MNVLLRILPIALVVSTGALAAPQKPCEVAQAKEIVFDDATPASESYVQWSDGKRSSLDGYSAQCKGSALSQRGKNSIPTRDLPALAKSGCSFSFDEGRCLCETPTMGGKFGCRSTGLKKITDALQKSEQATPKKASR